jgi:putative tail protein
MADPATGKGGGPTPFVNAFGNPAIGSLRYNTSQAGSPIHLCYGTCRVSVNLIEFWGFTGAGGGKGGKGLGSSAGKKGANQSYAVNVAFALCQGPASFTGASHGSGGNNRIWSNGGVAEGLAAVGLNGFPGSDGQAPDPVFASADPNTPVLGYSGTCYVTGTPMQLGGTPALPNLQFEVTGMAAGTAGPDFPDDARPDHIVTDLLSNPRYGAGFPAANLDSGSIADWGNYCQAAKLAMSLLLDRQQPCARWLEEIAQLTVSAVVCSGTTVKIIPYGDQALGANGASWAPNLTWEYSLGDADFIDFGGGSDPVLLLRDDPAQATNWLSIEYMDSGHSYNPQIVPVWDQGLIDRFGLRSEPPVQAHEFTNPSSAALAAQLMLQRKAYIRNTYRFKLGWRYSRLEPMDIVLLTDPALGLAEAPVRITQIDEDDNGELTVTAEEIPGVTP